MTVKRLREALEKYPDNMEVFLDERYSEFKFGLLNSVRSQNVVFTEGIPPEEKGETAEVECVILTEE